MRKNRLLLLLALLMTAATGAWAQEPATTYSVKMKANTQDAGNWSIASGEKSAKGDAADGLTGLSEGDAVTLTYNGRLKVKGVKATSDAAPAAAAFAADEYNEASWDDANKKVVYEKKKATTTPVAVADANTNVTWSDGWYTVSGNVTITGNVTLGADAHLILQDGATLTINGQLNCNANKKNLYIYGQEKGDGKLNVTNNGAHAIISNINYRIDIHGGEVTAAATGDKRIGLSTGYLAVYGGKLTATSGGGNGINFQNTFDVYGGEVEATSNATSSSNDHCGIRSGGGTSSQLLTVYGGKVTATGNGVTKSSSYGSGIGCYVMSGTSGIKFYFSEDGNTWDEGTSYASATSVGRQDDDAATKKRYVKATSDAAPATGKTVDLSKLADDYKAQNGDVLTGATSRKVTIAAGATVTLDGVTISSSGSGGYCIKCLGDATIILKDGSTNTLTCTGNQYPALSIGDAGTTLTIQGSTGVLNVTSGESCAGIGGGYKNANNACGNIRIEGGVITAQGGIGGAGIGTDCGPATCGDIIITGGTITAKGRSDAAGIGTGNGSYDPAVCGCITIANTVTKVTATKGNNDAHSIGKGYGDYASCGTVTIGGTKYWENNAAVNGGDTYLATSPLIYEPSN